MDFILKAADFMWANVIGYVLLAVGLYYSIRLGFPQFRHAGLIIPVVISVYEDRSFTFVTKTPPAAVLLKKAAKIEKGSGEPNKNKVAKVSSDQVREIAELKMEDLNAANVEAAMRMVEGTARSMGITVE